MAINLQLQRRDTVRYTKKQLENIDKYLLRKLQVGDHFKVLHLLSRNYNPDMQDFQDKWLTVENRNLIDYIKYSDPFYITENNELVYHVKEDAGSYRGSSNWHPYHMNIIETNRWILKKDTAVNNYKAKPTLPTI